VQKANIFYIYDKESNENNSGEIKEKWCELTKDKLIKFLNKLHLKISKHMYEWKKQHVNEIQQNETLESNYNKSLVKLMSIDFKQDSTLGKIRASMYQKMKTDMKGLIEYEFEF
jgi:hypothetical protein